MILRERANNGLHDFLFKVVMEQKLFYPGQNILDIGCGTGAWLSRFPESGIKVGIDLDTEQFGCLNAKAVTCNIDDYDGASWGKFQFITAFEIIEHLANPGQLFRIIQNNLADDGKVLVSTPNIHSLPARFRYFLKGRLPFFDDKSDPTHIYPVYLENINRLLPGYGLAIEKVMVFPENGYQLFKGNTVFFSRLVKPFVKDQLPGDNIILLIRKNRSK